MEPINKIIATIGQPGSGRSTVLYILAELLHEDGYKLRVFDFTKQPASELYYLMEHRYRPHLLRKTVSLYPVEQNLVLVDGVNNVTQAQLLRDLGAITVRVRCRKVPNSISWVEQFDTDFFIHNDDDFRLLKFQLRDLYKSEIERKLV